MMGMPFTVLMPVFADRILGGGPRGLGRWVAASASAFGLGLVAFAASRSFWLSAALLLACGFFMMMQMAASNTLLQVLAPDALRGRVMAAYTMMFLGLAPFGALGAGAAAHRLGAPWAVAIGGLAAIAGGCSSPSSCRACGSPPGPSGLGRSTSAASRRGRPRGRRLSPRPEALGAAPGID